MLHQLTKVGSPTRSNTPMISFRYRDQNRVWPRSNSHHLGLAVLCSVLPALASLANDALTHHKIRVNDPVVAAQLAAKGATLISDYGGFQLFDLPQMALASREASAVEIHDDYNFIFLNAATLDTAQNQMQAARSPLGEFSGKRMHLVQ